MSRVTKTLWQALLRWGSRLGVSVLAVLVLLVSLELGARIYSAIARPVPKDSFEMRIRRPPPYQDAPFFSREFLRESIAEGDWYTPPGTTFVLPEDFSGKYIHIEDGRRRTSFQPPSAENTVFLLGGSTMQSQEVPDEHTIASRLQLRLSGEMGDRYRVENLGVVTVNVRQQVERLETLELEKNDVVVFYDGFNDTGLTVFHLTPEGWVKLASQVEAKVEAHERLTIWFHTRLRTRSYFVRHLLNPYRPAPAPPHLAGGSVPPRILRQLERSYRSNIERAAAYCRENGALFFHFLQPHLFVQEQTSVYERQILDNPYIVPAGLKTAFDAGYPVLRQVVRELRQQGIESHDLSHVLSVRPDGEEFYLDHCHVNHRANEIIAGAMFDQIRGVAGP